MKKTKRLYVDFPVSPPKKIFFYGGGPDVWVTAERRSIPVSEMEMSHVALTVRMLRRRAFQMKLKVIRRNPKQFTKILEMPTDTFLLKHVRTYNALLQRCIKDRIPVAEGGWNEGDEK